MCSSCQAEDLVWFAAEKRSLPGPSALVPSDVQSDGRDGLDSGIVERDSSFTPNVFA